ncbi:hypothetical protein D3C75_982640 [compost metagenome]
MRTSTDKAIWRQAQTFACMAFIALGAVLLGLWMLRIHVSSSYREAYEGALYVACFFAIFTVRPLTDLFYSRLIRR